MCVLMCVLYASDYVFVWVCYLLSNILFPCTAWNYCLQPTRRMRNAHLAPLVVSCVSRQLINIELIWSASLKCQQQTLWVCPAAACLSLSLVAPASCIPLGQGNPIALFVSLFLFLLLFHVVLYSMCVIILRPCKLRTWKRTHMDKVFKPVTRGWVGEKQNVFGRF